MRITVDFLWEAERVVVETDGWGTHGTREAFEEDERGTIAPGQRADLTVFTRDVTAVAPPEILSTQVSFTVLGGAVEGNLR